MTLTPIVVSSAAGVEARVVAILRYTLRSDVPQKLNSDNQRDSVTEKSTAPDPYSALR
jgi:hypothetical protein